LLKNLLLILGIILLFVSLWPIRRLVLQLPPGRVRRSWHLLSVLVCLFIAGYMGHTLIFWRSYRNHADLIVPVIFFFGAVFVCLVSTLSLQTANDLKRIFVLEYESTTDSLMGIYNRRYLEKRLHEEFFRSLRYGHTLSLVMIDLDHFKQVNDEWGHQFGDIVLKRLAELIINTVREADVVCRYGGDELLLVLPHTVGSDAAIMAEKLRIKIEKTEFITADKNINHNPVWITVSIGVSTLFPEMDSAHTLLGQADKALYFAKQRGRNRTVCCEDLTDSGKC
ncbi:MAG: GGDEF domain-containing protein, partial [Desulfofustis sp.]|nr:GGDEF domain-containing protein [Desulfofustis sp.]